MSNTKLHDVRRIQAVNAPALQLDNAVRYPASLGKQKIGYRLQRR